MRVPNWIKDQQEELKEQPQMEWKELILEDLKANTVKATN